LKNTSVHYNCQNKIPPLFYIFKYLIIFYSTIAGIILKSINGKLFGLRYHYWTIFIGKGLFLESSLDALKPVKLSRKEFWADPFILKYEGDNYVFFERYLYKTKEGIISCGKIENDRLVDIRDILELEYHLSFPFIFEENGEIFLMPETNRNKRIEIYKCTGFPDKWELYSTALEGEKLIDPVLYKDNQNQIWLFVNIGNSVISSDTDLHIFKVNSLKMNELIPHKQNPVIIDCRRARNAGALFRYKGDLYRPSQCNIDGIYGRGLNINKVKKLSIDEYIEEPVLTIMPDFQKHLSGIHHMHQANDCFVFDAAYKKKGPFSFYKKS